MRLESARDLKQTLLETVICPLTSSVPRRRALGVPAGPMRAVGQPPETMALGIARKRRGDYVLAVRVQRRALERGDLIDTIRKQAKAEVDVRYIGRVTKAARPWHQKRNRPLRIGGSIGHDKITAGTLGCFVRAPGSDRVLILSNNHVLANENRAAKGDNILQPGPADGGRDPQDAVAALLRFLMLKRRGPNLVDCAVAEMDDAICYNHRNLTGIGRLAGLGDVVIDEGDAVAKIGRTTGLTYGRVTAFEMDDIVVGFDVGDLRFDNQIEIEGTDGPFDDGGDSGSLIVDDSGRGVGLLFAGSDEGGENGSGLTYTNPIHAVLDALKVELMF